MTYVRPTFADRLRPPALLNLSKASAHDGRRAPRALTDIRCLRLPNATPAPLTARLLRCLPMPAARVARGAGSAPWCLAAALTAISVRLLSVDRLKIEANE